MTWYALPTNSVQCLISANTCLKCCIKVHVMKGKIDIEMCLFILIMCSHLLLCLIVYTQDHPSKLSYMEMCLYSFKLFVFAMLYVCCTHMMYVICHNMPSYKNVCKKLSHCKYKYQICHSSYVHNNALYEGEALNTL